ncbi:MAG: DinB family protein [Candidatus Thorarchaeota archaeon]|nr:MAG: DinB family protein [Candidatus Thorarchaeota archaeon]
MNEEWFRRMLIEAHNNQRTHLQRIIHGLDEETLRRLVSEGERYSTILDLIWHLGAAEVYWFYKAGHPIGPRYDDSETSVVLNRLSENSDRIAEVINTCSQEQLRIIPPSPEGGPSVAWALLRTFMHGIYHAGQIAKIRRVIGAPELPEEEVNSWALAVDSVGVLVHGLLHDDLP